METIKLTREENFLQGLDQFGNPIQTVKQLYEAFEAVSSAVYQNYGDNAVRHMDASIMPKFRELARKVTLEPKQDQTGEVRKLINYFREA